MSHKSTILIVDDDATIREILEGLLTTQGYNLAFATDGKEALAKAAELTPDLILLDVMMPNMDGFAVCRRLRTDPGLAQVPVIMLTALDDRESRLKGIGVGADDFISKPFDSAELRLRVQTITRLNRYRRLLMERNKFEWVVNHAEDGYIELNDDGQILYANPKALSLLGIPEDGTGPSERTFLELAMERYQCHPLSAWNNWPAPAPNNATRYLIQPESPTLNSFWLQVELLEMSAGVDEKYMIRLQDITSEVVTQRIMWTFHEQVSHKLRTPLTKLTGFLSLLADPGSAFSEEEKRIMATTANSSALKLQEEILSIFEFLDKITVNNTNQVACSLTEFFSVADQIADALELSPMILPHTFANPDGTYISMSQQNLESILFELFDNAKKFHPTQSPALTVQVSDNSKSIRLEIGDDGATLTPDELVKMWTPYYQVEKFFSGQMPGMGLGLAMVASLVWSKGGSCHATNQTAGPGIIVNLTLPRATA